MFRDWLRTHPEDRDRYAEVKREVAARGFTDAMLYNNAKAWVVYDLYEKAFAGDPEHALPQRGDDPVARGGVPPRPRRVGRDDLHRRRHPDAQLGPSGVDVLLGWRLERVPEGMGTHAVTVVVPASVAP